MRKPAAGIAILELLIGMTLGLLLIAGLVSLFIQQKEHHRQNEAIAHMQDSGRFALHVLSRELLMAGHWGGPPDASQIEVDEMSLVLPAQANCGASAELPFALNISRSLVFENNLLPASLASRYDCLDVSDLLANTDLLAVRYADGNAKARMSEDDTETTLTPYGIYVQSNPNGGTVFRHGAQATYAPKPDYSPVSPPLSVWPYVFRIYYLRPWANLVGDGIPALCRRDLKATNPPEMIEECLAHGVEDLQIQWGIDQNGDGLPDRYLNAPGVADLANATTAELSVLVRSREKLADSNQAKVLSMADKQNVTFPADRYMRRLYTTSVALRNKALR